MDEIAELDKLVDAKDARITALEAENAKLREALIDIYKMDKIDAALDPEWAIRVSAATLSQIDKYPGTN